MTSPSQAPGFARGRPRIQEMADDIVASVLATAGPRVSTPEFSTRRIAELTGLSQSLVSRAVRRIRTAGQVPTSTTPPGPPLQVSELSVQYPRITVALSPDDSTDQRGKQPASVQRRAAALMSALWVSGAAAWAPAREPVPQAATGAAHSAVWDPATGEWEDFLRATAGLLSRCSSSDALPGDLLRLLAARARRGLHGVAWSRGEAPGVPSSWRETGDFSDSKTMTVAEFPAPARDAMNRWLPRTELSATEQIAIALRKEMTNSGFSAGDRLSPAAMAERLGLGQSTVRTAMRQLADDGLLVHSAGGFRIPNVAGADVIDLYASRLHVGMVVLRGCGAQPRNRLLPARLALRSLEAAARQGTRADVGEADLRFQQELADASGLTQSARSFHALTLRVRMFISVLQLDYSPAVERLVSDDRRLLSAVLEGRAQEAVRIWRAKLDHAVRHMSALAPESFDAALWDRLTHS